MGNCPPSLPAIPVVCIPVVGFGQFSWALGRSSTGGVGCSSTSLAGCGGMDGSGCSNVDIAGLANIRSADIKNPGTLGRIIHNHSAWFSRIAWCCTNDNILVLIHQSTLD